MSRISGLPTRRRLRPRPLGAGLIAFWAALAALAHEAPRPASAETLEPDRERARVLFREGVVLLDAARFEEARGRFQLAYTLWENPKILLNLATTERALGNDARAANLYARYQRVAEADAARAAEIAQILAALDQTLSRLEFAGARGDERLWLNEERVALDGQAELRVAPGEYSLRIERPASRSKAQRLALEAGQRLVVDLGERRSAPSRPRASTPQPSKEPDSAERTPRSGFRDELSVLARADFDPPRRGVVGAAGAAFALTDSLRVTGGALVGGNFGAWLGLEYVPLRGYVSPMFGVSAPTFFVDGIRPGASAEVGLRVEATRGTTPFIRVAVTHFPNASERYVPTLVIPSLGVEVCL